MIPPCTDVETNAAHCSSAELLFRDKSNTGGKTAMSEIGDYLSCFLCMEYASLDSELYAMEPQSVISISYIIKRGRPV